MHNSCWRYLRKHEKNQWERWLNLIFGPLLLMAAGARMIPCLVSVLRANVTKKKISP